ncbi:MAG: DNA-processing protein DprA [Desulfobacterales bacterium]|jgi:DNA processing protein
MTEKGRKTAPRTGLHHLQDDCRDRVSTKPVPIEAAGAAEALLPWFLLKSVPGIGNHLFKRLIDRFGSPERAFQAAEQDFQVIEGMNQALVGRIKTHRLHPSVRHDMALAAQKGVRIVTMTDPDYPALLLQIPDPPPFLYVRGKLESQCKAVAVVGSRIATRYGLSMAARLSAELAACGVTVVSGMARGIDTAAHEGALQSGGRTVAVLGSGLEKVYPAENRKLFQTIVRNGAVLSEFPMLTKPEPHNFPIRNRIISGMSYGTVIVEASKKSGSLITARLAAEQNREVFAVPGSVQSFKSIGTHTLIKQGAKLVENAQDVLEEIAGPLFEGIRLDDRPPPTKKEPPALSTEEAIVCGALEPYPIHIDDLGRKLSMAPGKLASILLQLELNGIVEQSPGNFFTRVDDASFRRHHLNE